jgi:predicted transcriptional regulator
MSERRSQLEIVHDILQAIMDKGGKIKPTHLLYKSNLSHQRMMKYIEELMQKNLMTVTNEKDKSFYILTDQGNDFLNNYRKIKEFTDAFGL